MLPIAPLRDILHHAFQARYGVPAVNIVNDLTLEAVLAAAVEARSPMIIQTSVKTVRSAGSGVLIALWNSMTAGIEVPVCLHLDHCPDRSVITECLTAGWNSVLFDASALPVAENQRQTVEVVREATRTGADVEGEIETITGVEDGLGSNQVAERQLLDVVAGFIAETGVAVFAPAIGNAHGRYSSEPDLDYDRVSEIVERTNLPIALHGGTGLSPAQFAELIARGCAKINISTALKQTFMQSGLSFLQQAAARDEWDPPSLFAANRRDVMTMVTEHIDLFGSRGMAW